MLVEHSLVASGPLLFTLQRWLVVVTEAPKRGFFEYFSKTAGYFSPRSLFSTDEAYFYRIDAIWVILPPFSWLHFRGRRFCGLRPHSLCIFAQLRWLEIDSSFFLFFYFFFSFFFFFFIFLFGFFDCYWISFDGRTGKVERGERGTDYEDESVTIDVFWWRYYLTSPIVGRHGYAPIS